MSMLREADGRGQVGVNVGEPSLQRGRLRVWGQTRAMVVVTWIAPLLTVGSGLQHLAEALSFRHDLEMASSTVQAVIATLRSGEKCTVEPELISKGTTKSCPLPLLPTWNLLRCVSALGNPSCWPPRLSQPPVPQSSVASSRCVPLTWKSC